MMKLYLSIFKREHIAVDDSCCCLEPDFLNLAMI